MEQSYVNGSCALLSRHRSGRIIFLFIAMVLLLYFSVQPVRAQEEIITVFVPSVPGIDALPNKNQGDAKGKKVKSIWKNEEIPEADILMSLMRPHAYEPFAMDRPQSFAMFFQADKAGENGEAARKDLLGDVEEIRYLDQKAWGANVALAEPGLYQFLLEGKPVWDAEKNRYFQHMAKLYVPVLSEGAGWDKAISQGLEIVPLNRPFGLRSPALFRGRLQNGDKPVANTRIVAGRINSSKKPAQTIWHRTLESRTDTEGIFSFIFNEPGWWYCKASVEGEPLKGNDGEMKDMEKSAILWIYVNRGDEERTGK